MHFILIDTDSGYIFADTRDLAGYDPSYATGLRYAEGIDAAAKYAAETLDRSLMSQMSQVDDYKIVSRGTPDSYDAYRVDINGSEAVALVRDGQDQETIDTVEHECDYVTTIRRVYNI